MALLHILERLLNRSQNEEKKVELKEIFCKSKGDGFLKQFRTAAVGCQYSNRDGSSRQDALKKLKVGERVRLIWNAEEASSKDTVYLLKSGRGQELFLPDCFGRLDDKITAKVVRWLTRDNIVTAAKVVRITGGTRKQPRLGCVLELSTYPGPREKSEPGKK